MVGRAIEKDIDGDARVLSRSEPEERRHEAVFLVAAGGGCALRGSGLAGDRVPIDSRALARARRHDVFHHGNELLLGTFAHDALVVFTPIELLARHLFGKMWSDRNASVGDGVDGT